ncbi:MAG: Na/Pi cotransporter family protein [Spirochaetia bacterium]|nr:Na/Pi cotransporter family protein [Spirochaetia bacterium]
MSILPMALTLIGGLALFMYGMERSSESIQRAAGERLQSALNMMTKNSIVGVLTGAIVTILVQSSSATTVMLITFVNAGLLSLTQAIGVIMGANIGTTLTGWIIAAVGIAKFSIISLAVPLFGIGFFMSIAKRKSDSFRSYGNAIMGLAFIFLGLDFIERAIPTPSASALLFLQNFSKLGYGAILISVLVGTVFTMLVNASSATLAIVIAMASQGIIDFNIAAALTLGANIGTTLDAFLASISTGTNTNARRAAWAHILFNVLGTVWVVILFKPFISLVDWVVPSPIEPKSIGVHIAMLHTLFNTLNTLLLLPFVRQYASFLERIIKEKPGEAELRTFYLPKTLMATPELSLIRARKEISEMVTLARMMFDRSRSLFTEKLTNESKASPDTANATSIDMDAEIEWFIAKENYADSMHEGLTKYLLSITSMDLSERTRERVNIKLRIVSELENMTDECLSIAFIIKKKHDKKLEFDPESVAALDPFGELVDEFLDFIAERLNVGINQEELKIASEMEDRIDDYKRRLKKTARYRLDRGADVRAELLYIDLIRHIEKIGDCAYAIAEELRNLIPEPKSSYQSYRDQETKVQST